MSFQSDLRAFAEGTREKADDVCKGTINILSSRIIFRSPVDTGRFRGNWSLGVNAPEAQTFQERYDKNGAATLSAVMSSVPANAAGPIYYLTNNLPYGPRLEYEGWSKQAPNGMVRVSVLEFQQIVRAALAGVAA